MGMLEFTFFQTHPRRHQMKRLIAAILGASFLLAACSTMEGFGRDVQSGGKKIEHEAQEHR